MEILLTPHAFKQLNKLPPPLKAILKSKILTLDLDPFPHGYKKLTGRNGYRLRYGDYRIIYKISTNKQITIEAVAHRKEIYKI